MKECFDIEVYLYRHRLQCRQFISTQFLAYALKQYPSFDLKYVSSSVNQQMHICLYLKADTDRYNLLYLVSISENISDRY